MFLGIDGIRYWRNKTLTKKGCKFDSCVTRVQLAIIYNQSVAITFDNDIKGNEYCKMCIITVTHCIEYKHNGYPQVIWLVWLFFGFSIFFAGSWSWHLKRNENQNKTNGTKLLKSMQHYSFYLTAAYTSFLSDNLAVLISIF